MGAFHKDAQYERRQVVRFAASADETLTVLDPLVIRKRTSHTLLDEVF